MSNIEEDVDNAKESADEYTGFLGINDFDTAQELNRNQFLECVESVEILRRWKIAQQHLINQSSNPRKAKLLFLMKYALLLEQAGFLEPAFDAIGTAVIRSDSSSFADVEEAIGEQFDRIQQLFDEAVFL